MVSTYLKTVFKFVTTTKSLFSYFQTTLRYVFPLSFPYKFEKLKSNTTISWQIWKEWAIIVITWHVTPSFTSVQPLWIKKKNINELTKIFGFVDIQWTYLMYWKIPNGSRPARKLTSRLFCLVFKWLERSTFRWSQLWQMRVDKGRGADVKNLVCVSGMVSSEYWTLKRLERYLQTVFWSHHGGWQVGQITGHPSPLRDKPRNLLWKTSPKFQIF